MSSVNSSSYCQTYTIRCTIVRNKIVDHSDVVGASHVSTAPTTSLFSTLYMDSMDWAKTSVRRHEKYFSFVIWSLDEYHVHIWQVCPQLGCGNTCRIWRWFREPKRYFSCNGEINTPDLNYLIREWVTYLELCLAYIYIYIYTYIFIYTRI